MRLKLDKYIKRIDPRGLLDEGSRNNDYNVEKSVESAKVKQRANVEIWTAVRERGIGNIIPSNVSFFEGRSNRGRGRVRGRV